MQDRSSGNSLTLQQKVMQSLLGRERLIATADIYHFYVDQADFSLRHYDYSSRLAGFLMRNSMLASFSVLASTTVLKFFSGAGGMALTFLMFAETFALFIGTFHYVHYRLRAEHLLELTKIKRDYLKANGLEFQKHLKDVQAKYGISIDEQLAAVRELESAAETEAEAGGESQAKAGSSESPNR